MKKRCIVAWKHLCIETTGEVKMCCQYTDLVRDKNGIPFNMSTDSIDDVLNSDYVKNFRQQSLDGNLPPLCNQCKEHEETGVESRRERMNIQLGEPTDDMSIDFHDLTSLELRLDNTCNLMCNICSPTCSSKWLAKMLQYRPGDPELLAIAKKNKWLKNNDRFWNDLKEKLPRLRSIYVNGGEPFMNKKHLEFMNFLANSEHASNITVHYNTNGTVIPSIDVAWEKFKKYIHFSIDDIGDRFEFQRRLGKWKEVQKTVDFFKQNKTENSIYGICCAVSIQNILTIDSMIKWAIDQDCFDVLRLNVLQLPAVFALPEMTIAIQKEAVERLRRIRAPHTWMTELNALATTVENMVVNPSGNFIHFVNSLAPVDKTLFLEGHSDLTRFLSLG